MTMLEAAIFLCTRICGGDGCSSRCCGGTRRSTCAAAAWHSRWPSRGFGSAAVGGLFVLIALHGALPLLLTALGLLFARPVVQRCLMGGAA